MSEPTKTTPDSEGEEITWQNGTLVVPDVPIIPFIEGDGVGPDIWLASVQVFDAAVLVKRQTQSWVNGCLLKQSRRSEAIKSQ